MSRPRVNDLQAALDVAAAMRPSVLEVGATYTAIGPADGSKLGPPMRIRVLEDLGDRVRVQPLDGTRLVAPVVMRDAAHLWRRGS